MYLAMELKSIKLYEQTLLWAFETCTLCMWAERFQFYILYIYTLSAVFDVNFRSCVKFYVFELPWIYADGFGYVSMKRLYD